MISELIFAMFHHRAYSLSFKERFELWKEMRRMKKEMNWARRIEFLKEIQMINPV